MKNNALCKENHTRSLLMTSARFDFTHRQGYTITVSDIPQDQKFQPQENLLSSLDQLNTTFRALVSILYNCVPTSGHPGGSISSSWIVESLLYHTMKYDFSNPDAAHADIISYAAGHKALGLYGIWALRNEIVRITAPELLPEERFQLRLEDLLGFRRNPSQHTNLFKKHHAKPLDGHPSPATPFIKISTGASGVGVPSSFGMALGAIDLYPDNPPQVHIIEGEGGLTSGRIHEAMACAATANIHNITLHVDWNQASIDSNHVCRDGDTPGDYVQWNPVELARFHDFNVIFVENGMNHADILAAQAYANKNKNSQPTAIVYQTVKGHKYGIEGAASHGAGHKCCSQEFYNSLQEFEKMFDCNLPRYSKELDDDNSLEEYYFELLMSIRKQIETHKDSFSLLGERIRNSKESLSSQNRKMRSGAPDLSPLYDSAKINPENQPEGLVTPVGQKTTLRGALGSALGYLNDKTAGSFIAASADLMGSTSINKLAKNFPKGFFNTKTNPLSRMLACGGICEDSMGALLASLGVDGRHIGAGSSYGAFIVALQHIAIRLHAIGQMARKDTFGTPYSTYIMVCAHAGLKTGEDGPTHADPQCLQLIQENFPKGTLITLTPWDPNEMWSCVVAGLQKRPAILAPFVTRPTETILDRKALGIPPVSAAAKGIYAVRKADPNKKPYHGTVVLQGSGIANTFFQGVLPKIIEDDLNINIYYVSSLELFDLLPDDEKELIFPEDHAKQAMGITGFTLSTLYRWVTSTPGRNASLHAFSKGRFPGSGQAHKVFEEAGLDAKGQYEAILRYSEKFSKNT
jgi:transketolase